MEDFRALVVVREHDRIAFVFQRLDLTHQIEVRLPLHQRHQAGDAYVALQMLAAGVL